MSWIIFVEVALLSTLLTVIWQWLFKIYPAWKKLAIARAHAELVASLVELNRGALLDRKICNGHYLHDRYYKFVFKVMVHRNSVKVPFAMLSDVKHDEKSERDLRRFRQEIQSLDEATREIIKNASYAVGKILFIRNPILFPLVCIMQKKGRSSFLSRKARIKGFTDTAEYIVFSETNGTDGMTYAPT